MSDSAGSLDLAVKIAEMVGGFSTLFAAFIATVALTYAYRQIVTTRLVAREVDAYAAYSEYLKLCVAHPQYTSSRSVLAIVEGGTLDGFVTSLDEVAQRYSAFLSFMLTAFEKILQFSNLPDWRASVKDELAEHVPGLRSLWPHFREHYSAEFQMIVDGVIGDEAVPAKQT